MNLQTRSLRSKATWRIKNKKEMEGKKQKFIHDMRPQYPWPAGYGLTCAFSSSFPPRNEIWSAVQWMRGGVLTSVAIEVNDLSARNWTPGYVMVLLNSGKKKKGDGDSAGKSDWKSRWGECWPIWPTHVAHFGWPTDNELYHPSVDKDTRMP